MTILPKTYVRINYFKERELKKLPPAGLVLYPDFQKNNKQNPSNKKFPKEVTPNQLLKPPDAFTLDKLNQICNERDKLANRESRFTPYVQLQILLNRGNLAQAVYDAFDAGIKRLQLCELDPKVAKPNLWAFTMKVADRVPIRFNPKSTLRNFIF